MAHLDIRKFIAASPEAVWAVLADLEHHAAWMVDVRALDIVTKQRQGVGAVITSRASCSASRSSRT